MIIALNEQSEIARGYAPSRQRHPDGCRLYILCRHGMANRVKKKHPVTYIDARLLMAGADIKQQAPEP